MLARESQSGFAARGAGDDGGGGGGGGRFGFGFGGDDNKGDFVNFPSPSFLTGLSEVKPHLRRNETRTISLTLRVPPGVSPGARKVVFVEVQPFGNNVAGTSLFQF